MPHHSQKTLRGEVVFEGRGLHTGRAARVRLKGAPVGFGLRFSDLKTGLGEITIGDLKAVDFASERRTRIGAAQNGVETIEHLLSALAGLGVSNARIEVDGEEIPALDGSALPFVRAIREAGVVEQKARQECIAIREPLFCSGENTAICVFPYRGFKITYTMDYPHPALKAQTVSLDITEGTFVSRIAPARTFCTREEALFLRRKGFGKGANFGNTLVFSKKGPIRNRLRFKDECARHKILDLIGDLALAGRPVEGHFVAVRSGHYLNRRLLAMILNKKGNTA